MAATAVPVGVVDSGTSPGPALGASTNTSDTTTVTKSTSGRSALSAVLGDVMAAISVMC